MHTEPSSAPRVRRNVHVLARAACVCAWLSSCVAALLAASSLARAAAPMDLVLDGATVDENAPDGTVIGRLQALDAAGVPVGATWALTIDDGDAFALDGDHLVTRRALDAETSPSLIVRARATTTDGGWRERSFAIAVADVDEPPSALWLDGDRVPEDAAIGDVVGRIVASDPDVGDALVIELGSRDGALALDGDVLRVAAPLDAEAGPAITLTVRATDRAGHVLEVELAVAIDDVDEPATGLVLEGGAVPENAPAGAVIGGLFVVGDPDPGETYTLSVVGPERARFAVNAGVLTTLAPLDHEAGALIDVPIGLLGSRGAWSERVVQVVVTDRDEPARAIRFVGDGLAEDLAPGADVGRLVVDDDADARHTLRKVRCTPDVLDLVGDRVVQRVALDHEATALVTLVVEARDERDRPLGATLVLAVADRAEPPLSLALSSALAPEGDGDRFVGRLSAIDPDGGPITFALVDDLTRRFRIDGDALRVVGTIASPTTITVRATDATGLTTSQAFTVSALASDVGAPELTLTARAVDEGLPAGTVIGRVRVDGAEPDGGVLSYAGGSAALTLHGDALVTTRVLDHEAGPYLTASVWWLVQGVIVHQHTFAITVRDVPEPPDDLRLSATTIAEDAPVGAVVARVSAFDPDAADVVSLFLGADAERALELEGDSLIVRRALDFEREPTLAITLHAVDARGAMLERAFELTVGDVDEAPSTVTLDVDEVREDAPLGSVVGTIVPGPDPEGDAVDAMLVGDGRFAILDGRLVTAAPLDFESVAKHTLHVRLEDRRGAVSLATLSVRVVDVPEAPAPIALVVTPLPENAPAGAVVAEVQGGADPDHAPAPTLVVRAPVEGLAVDGRRLVTTRPFDFEREAGAAIEVAWVDAAAGVERVARGRLRMIDVDEPPIGVALSADSVPETAPPTWVVARVLVEDDGPPPPLSLGGEGADVLALDGDRLVVTGALDARARAALPITVRAGDGPAHDFVIHVRDNAAPVIGARALTPVEVDEDAVGGRELSSIMAELGASDPDGVAVPALTLFAAASDAGRWELESDGIATPLTSDRTVATRGRVRFVPAPDFAGEVPAALRVGAWDGLAASVETRPLAARVLAVNDPPSLVVPPALTTLQGIALPLWRTASGVVVPLVACDDPDADEAALVATVAHGRIDLAEVAGPVSIARGETTRIEGPLAAVATALGSARYVPDPGFSGADAITWTLSDRGGTGRGGELTTSATTAIEVAPAAAMTVRRVGGGALADGEQEDLGRLQGPAFRHHRYTVTNDGDDDLRLGDGRVRVEGQDLAAWVALAPPATLAPGASAPLVVTTWGDRPGPVGFKLTLASNDPRVPFFTLFAHGELAPAPALELFVDGRRARPGTPFALGPCEPVAPEVTCTVPVTVANVGLAPLTVERAQLLEVVPPGAASLHVDVTVAGVGEAVGGTLTWAADPIEARLRLETDDPDAPTLDVALVSGALPEEVPAAGDALVVARAGRAIAHEAWDDVGGVAPGREIDYWLVPGERLPAAIQVGELVGGEVLPLEQPVGAVRGVPQPIAFVLTPSGTGPMSARVAILDEHGALLHAFRVVSRGPVPTLRLVGEDDMPRMHHTVDYVPWLPAGRETILRYRVQNRGTGLLKLAAEPRLSDLRPEEGRAVCAGARMVATWDIVPGAASEMWVTLAPDDRDYECLLAIDSDDPNVPHFEMVLAGPGRASPMGEGCAAGGGGGVALALALLVARRLALR